jgi:hypothetical protein
MNRERSAIAASRPVGVLRRRGRAGALLAGLALLAGCAGVPGMGGSQSPAAAAAPTPQDPLIAFAATAVPGQQGRVATAGGAPTNVRLLRSYAAASGRECREVLVGTGEFARPQLICQTEGGGWAAARPLLRGGGTQRP